MCREAIPDSNNSTSVKKFPNLTNIRQFKVLRRKTSKFTNPQWIKVLAVQLIANSQYKFKVSRFQFIDNTPKINQSSTKTWLTLQLIKGFRIKIC